MLESLSSREREIFELLLKGISPKEISYKLNIKHSTVDFHRSKIYNKLGIHKIQELLAKYSTNGKEEFDDKIAEKSAAEVYVIGEEINGTLIDDILNIKINMAEMGDKREYAQTAYNGKYDIIISISKKEQ